MLIRTLLLLLLAVAGFSASSDLGLGPAPVTSAAPSGAAGGDLGGTYPNPTVTAARFSTPGAIGDGTPSTGAFTTISGSTSITDSGLTATRVTFAGTAGLLSDDAGMTYTAASDLLVVNHNAAALPAIPAADDTVIQVGGLDATTTRVLIDGFGGSPTFAGRAASGTNAIKTAVINGTILCQLVGLGYDGSAYSTGKANVILSGSETWSGTQTGTKMLFNLVPSGTTTNTTIITLTPTLYTQVSTDAVTATAPVVATWQHVTSGTAAASFGATLQIQGADDGGTQRVMSQFSTQWTDPANATRSSKLSFVLSANAALFNALILAPTIATFQSTDAVTAAATIVANFTHSTSGTAAANFGNTIQISGPDDGGTSRSMAQISTQWTTAASATRASKLIFNVAVAAVNTTALTINPTAINIASGFPVTVSDTTASSTTAGALLIGTGTAATSVTFGGGAGNIGSTLTVGSTTDGTSGSAGAISTLGGIGVTKAGWFGGIVTANGATAAATQPSLVTAGTSTIAGGVTDAYTASHRLTPVYNGAFTVTRHNYIDLNQITGASTVTDACVFRFDAAAGTHKALNTGTTKTTPGTVNAWMVLNVNGTLYYVPCYTSKTSMVSPIERAVRATITLPTEPDDQVSYVRAQEAA